MNTNSSQRPSSAASDESERFRTASDVLANVSARRVDDDASRGAGENERVEREREREPKRGVNPFERAGGGVRSSDGGNSFASAPIR